MLRRHLFPLTVLCLMLVPSLAFGAIKLQKSRFGEKGKIHVGGEVFGWSSMTTEPDEGEGSSTSSSLGIKPMVGYFVIPGLEVGAMLNYNMSSTEVDTGAVSTESDSSEFSLGPFAAYYYKVSPILHIYGRGYFMFLATKDDGSDNDYSRSTLGLGAGVAIPVGHKVGGVFNVGVDYVMNWNTTEVGSTEIETTTNGPMLGTGFSLYF